MLAVCTHADLAGLGMNLSASWWEFKFFSTRFWPQDYCNLIGAKMFLQLGQVRYRHNNTLAFVASSFIIPCEVTSLVWPDPLRRQKQVTRGRRKKGEEERKKGLVTPNRMLLTSANMPAEPIKLQ